MTKKTEVFETLKWRGRKPLNKKELERMYLKKGMSTPEIAEALNVNATHVRDEMRRLGIRIRTLSEAQRIRRKKGGDR